MKGSLYSKYIEHCNLFVLRLLLPIQSSFNEIMNDGVVSRMGVLLPIPSF